MGLTSKAEDIADLIYIIMRIGIKLYMLWENCDSYRIII